MYFSRSFDQAHCFNEWKWRNSKQSLIGHSFPSLRVKPCSTSKCLIIDQSFNSIHPKHLRMHPYHGNQIPMTTKVEVSLSLYHRRVKSLSLFLLTLIFRLFFYKFWCLNLGDDLLFGHCKLMVDSNRRLLFYLHLLDDGSFLRTFRFEGSLFLNPFLFL